MITLLIFALLWGLCGGKSEAIENFTDSQMAIAFLIMVASDLNIIINSFRNG